MLRKWAILAPPGMPLDENFANKYIWLSKKRISNLTKG